jgi:aspartyl-tRNA(Asn)/glutamyl-tRNA(Gln) amidotransferase subunit A
MNTDDLAFTPATELAAMIRQKTISPVEVMQATLARIEALEPKVNAFAYLAADAAMAAAKQAEAALMSGARIGRLHGVPATIKDLAITADMPTQAGTQIMKGNQPTEDTPIVPRLRDEGAIIIGKTTTSEFGWTGVSRSPLTGITHNPWKYGYNAGASSAGAGAAAAAGFGPLHQGSDGAGSVRMPSHFCGIFGLKPSFGRVPYYPVGTGDFTSHIGPMTRTVADAALMLEVMAGPHPLDFTTTEAGPAPYLQRLLEGIAGKRIAYSPDMGVARVDPDVAALVKAAVDRFAALGAIVEEAGALLLARPYRTAPAAPGRVGVPDGPRTGSVHPGGCPAFDHRLPDHARAEDGLYRRGASLVPGLGFPADPRRLGGRLPRREIAAGALAAA